MKVLGANAMTKNKTALNREIASSYLAASLARRGFIFPGRWAVFVVAG